MNVDIGDIIIVFEFDREILIIFLFVLIVYVVDLSGLSVRISSVIVEIFLLDKNDNSLIFLFSVYRLSVKENLLVGVSVVIVFVIDKDDGFNVEFVYFIVDGNDGNVF